MHTKAPIYHAFLLSTLVSCTVFIDDQDKNPSVLWDGPWHTYTGYGISELAWKGTLSLGNQSGITVAFTFVGTSIQVFGPLWPNQTETAWSRYVIDDGRPTEFVPQELQAASRLKLYDSGRLPEGEHTLKITNLGPFLWLDYFALDVASSSAGSGTSRPTTTTTRPSSTPTTIRPSSTTIITASPSRSITSESAAATSSQMSDPGSTGTSSSVSSSSSSATSAPPPSYSTPLSGSSTSASSTSSSPNPTPSPQDAATSTPKAHAHGHGMSPTACIALITVATAGVVALLALILLYLRVGRRTRSSPPNPSSVQVQRPTPSDSEGDSDSHANGHASTLYSVMPPFPTTATATSPSVVRPASAFVSQAVADVVHSRARAGPRATDGGVSVAGGPGLGLNGDAPSISEADWEGEKDMLPPPYQGYAAP